MLLKIKTWEQLEKEYGLDMSQNIACCCSFTHEMKHFCGTTVKATSKTLEDLTTHRSTSHCPEFEKFALSRDMITKESLDFLDALTEAKNA